MFDKILKVMRDKIHRRQYVMTIHAEEEMVNDCLNIYDVERCILTGKITARQKDKVTTEWKYRINGKTIAGSKLRLLQQ